VAKVKLLLTDVEAALHAVVGTSGLLRARDQVAQGEVVKLRWHPGTGEALGQVHGHSSGFTVATLTTDPRGDIAFEGACTCGAHPHCLHPAALALLAMVETPAADEPKRGNQKQVADTPAWETALAKLSGETAAAIPRQAGSSEPGVALQFDLVGAQGNPATARRWRVAMRPVVPGRTGWVRGGISWSSLGYAHIGHGTRAEQQRHLLNEILSLSRSAERHHYGYYQQAAVFLDDFPSRRIWDLLAEAEEIGLPLVQTGKAATPVTVAQAPARFCLQASRTGEGLKLAPALMVDGAAVAAECSVLLGHPAHGVAWRGVQGGPMPAAKDRALRLAPLVSALATGVESAFSAAPILVPTHDEHRFFLEHYPKLVRRVEVVSAGEDVMLPDAGPATLTLTVDSLPRHQLGLGWQWVQSVGAEHYDEPLYATAPVGMAKQRHDLVQTVAGIVAAHVPGALEPSPGGTRLAEAATVAGDDVIRLLNQVMPALIELDGVEVNFRPGAADVEYHEVHDAPAISFGSTDAVAESDWFDLAVRITVGGEEVVFEDLFVALAQDRQYLILPSGTYFSLDRDEFRQLRELIAEARAMVDSPDGVLRVSRFQAGLWQELADLGEITGQARAWQESVRALAEIDDTVERPVPQSLRAVLRPYQRDGFAWLATLYDHGLGGILADDMGLGKTLQTLALICRAREFGGLSAPFLVVAPASVVHNWVSEAERFTPELKVRAITQTRARRLGCDLAEAVAGADVIVTSYTLFRLEHDDYQALKWDGLILDEAQFIKNHQSQGYRCARLLSAPFKLAITGTPMENNLAELWSVCSVTAPGLFPRLDRFTEYYRTPIEKGHDVERLAQLRRRIKPLMLRRKKADVVVDLPEKQEQIVELELDRRHRKVYQTYLQRERQKVLGLLGDLERNRFEIFRSLTLLRQASLDVSLVDPKHHNVPSTKLDVLSEQVDNLVAEGHRALVFSQFTRFLDAARLRLEKAGIQCCYLDGKTTNRKDVIGEFKSGTASVFLISLKAGGFGLNLTEADYCILLDPWWNPATEAQAVDRVHRIGQTRHVMVYRMVAKDTIEEKVMALKARKAELFNSVLDGGDFASARLTASDIRALLD
jgi:superfamily II DNA or RNA helicase